MQSSNGQAWAVDAHTDNSGAVQMVALSHCSLAFPCERMGESPALDIADSLPWECWAVPPVPTSQTVRRHSKRLDRKVGYKWRFPTPEAVSNLLHGDLILYTKAWSIAQSCCQLTLTFKFTHISVYALPHGSWLVASFSSHPACLVTGWHLPLTLPSFFPSFLV